MFYYGRAVYYYETDKMGVVHHSNYVRWFEEARIGYLASIGLPFMKIEIDGVLCPVIGVDIRFKRFARFGDSFTVKPEIRTYTGLRLTVGYTAVNQDGVLLAEGESRHTFVDLNYRPVPLQKKLPDAHKILTENTVRGD